MQLAAMLAEKPELINQQLLLAAVHSKRELNVD